MTIKKYRLTIAMIAAIAAVAGAAGVAAPRPSAHAATLIPVSLTPQTTLTAETSNNTSAANNFGGWPDGNEAASNISKVNVHTLLYPGNTTQIFALLEPWFCVNATGTVSYTDHCQSHAQVGYNEFTTAQGTAMVGDMISRGLDGVVCDFYGVAYDTKTANQQASCDNVAAAAQASGGKLLFAAQQDDGSWKWRCDITTSPTGWSKLGYANAEDCIVALFEKDLSYYNTHYFGNSSYWRVNGRPVIVPFINQTSAQENIGSTAWADAWAKVKAYASTHGNPYFVFENALTTGSMFWNVADGAFGWPQPKSNTTLDFGNDAYPDYFYTTLNKDSLAIKMGTAYKGFNDSVASWSSSRIINQSCGQTWVNGIWNKPAADGFGTGNQLQSLLIATWNDYEEGTEVETGIDNCVSIGANLSGTTLNWNVTGQTNTLDHYTVYLSTDGQNLAVLQDNISPSVTSLDLSQYGIPSGSYQLYVKAVGKPMILNHTSGAVTYTVAASASCTTPTLAKGTVSPVTVAPGGAYQITCDYGWQGSGIAVTPGSGTCTYSNFNGTTAVFNCTAGTMTGTFQNYCRVGNWNTLNYCAVNSPIASLTVTAAVPPSAPAGLAVTGVTASTISLHWNAATPGTSAIAGYKIYRNSTQIATTANTGYSDASLSPNTTYSYTLQTYDTTGATSGQTASVSGKTSQGTISVGTKVATTASVNVHTSPSPTATTLATEAAGAQGAVLAGPQTASGYTWWDVSYLNGKTGWTVASYLTAISNTPISLGKSIITTQQVNVRASASTASTKLGSEAAGTTGSVIGGPTIAGGYTWWNIKYSNGLTGWSVQDYLLPVALSSDDESTPPIAAGPGSPDAQGLANASRNVNIQALLNVIEQILQGIGK